MLIIIYINNINSKLLKKFLIIKGMYYFFKLVSYNSYNLPNYLDTKDIIRKNIVITIQRKFLKNSALIMLEFHINYIWKIECWQIN